MERVLRRHGLPTAAAALLLAATLALAGEARASNLLFWSGFESSAAVQPVAQANCWGTGCWQAISGTDSSTGFAWPPSIWGGGGYLMQLADTPTDATSIGKYMFDQILSVTGHKGSPTQALFSQITQSGCCGSDPQGWGSTSNSLVLLPATEAGEMYLSYWLKVQPGLLQQLTPQSWRFVFSWKTSGDYRTVLTVATWGGLEPYWQAIGDNAANGGLPYQKYWEVDNHAVPVPLGQWFKLEVFWHRSSGGDGRIWMAVNGQVICDRLGPNMGVDNDPINRIFVSGVYGGGGYPMYQWMDDLQIWDGFPSASSGDAWYDPPYAPH